MFGRLVFLANAFAIIATSSTDLNSAIVWSACGRSPPARECGHFRVPFDYHNPAAGDGDLAVIRVNATKQPRLGTLFVNPGGPGGEGVKWLLGRELNLLIQRSGGQYDLVSWDPRGTHNLLNVQLDHPSIRGQFLEIGRDFRNSTMRSEFYSHVDEVASATHQIYDACNSNSGGTLRYVGTAATVRDMVRLHDMLDGSPTINYWGVSYGTILGNVFVNMFPDRVGRVILDGVVNPWIYTTKPPLEALGVIFNALPKVLDGFVKECAAAGPSKCPIAKENSTAASILAWTLDLVQRAYDHAQSDPTTDTTSYLLRASIFYGLYSPTIWTSTADTLYSAYESLRNSSIQRRGPPIRHTWSMPRSIHPRQLESEGVVMSCAAAAVTCSDAIDDPETTTQDMFDLVVNITDNQTQLLGPLVWAFPNTFCQQWPARAVERYTGPFNRTLANKILVIGNTYDPITPLDSAKRIARALGSSAVLLELNGYGHASLAINSNCSNEVTVRYFSEGKLPDSKVVCQTEKNFFL